MALSQKTRHIMDLIAVLTQKELKAKYKNSFLGYLWSVGHPLAFAFVFYIAFKIVIRIDVENYTLFLLCGLFPWQWFNNSLNCAPLGLLQNSSLIKKVNFPRTLVPFSQVLLDMIHFLFTIPVIIVLLLIYRKQPSLSWIYGMPILLVIQFALTYGFSLLISSTNLFFRDLERVTSIFTTLLFYFTPIIYPETMVPAQFRNAMSFNPLAHLMVGWQNLLIKGTIDPLSMIVSLCYAIAILLAGLFVFRRLSWRFAEVL